MNVFLRGLLPALSARGISTCVLTRGTGRRTEETGPFPGVRIVHLPCGWRIPPTRESAHGALPRFLGKARKFLSSAGPWDAVSAHYWMSGMAALPLGLPFVFMYHTVEAFKRSASGPPPGGLSALRMEAERRLASAAARVVFFSREDFDRTRTLFPVLSGKGAVIPPGIDDPFRHPPDRDAARQGFGIPPEGFLFLLAARADPLKNTEEAVRTFLELRRKRGPAVRLFVAGQEGPASGVPEGVRYLGTVPHAGMPALYSAADAVLCPSSYESFGLVPLEAVAAGAPVIVPESGYWGGKVRSEGGGIVYDPGSKRGLREAMEKALAAKPGGIPSERAAGRLPAPFTWARCAGSWARILSTVSRPGSPR